MIFAQTDSILKKISAAWGSLDYSIPESPAFNLLGNNPDNLLKPTSVKSIAISLGNYYLSNAAVIPQNIGVEISPLLLNPKASLYDFRRNSFWYRFRFSLGTNVQEKGAFQIAEGFRFTIIDKSDLRLDREFLEKLGDLAVDKNKAKEKAIQEYYSMHHATYPDIFAVYDAYINNISIRTEIDEIAKKYTLNPDTITNFRNLKKQKLWNAQIWEMGMAALQQSPDSLISNAKFAKLSFWSTYGTHFNLNDQLLIGCKFEMADSLSKWKPKISIGTRYYYGKNELRGFVQGEYSLINQLNSATASAGLIFNITDGIWGQLAMNFIFDLKGNVTFAPGFNIGLGTTEKKI